MFRRIAFGPLVTAVLAMCALLGAAQEANASFQLRLEQAGCAPVTITDNGPGDSHPTVGAITFIGPYCTFDVNTTNGVSKPVVGNGSSQAEMDLNSLNVSSSTGGALEITLADTGYTFPSVNPLSLENLVGGTLDGAAGSSVTFQSWASASNLSPLAGFPTVIPAGSVTGGPLGPFGPGVYDATVTTSFNRGAGPYSVFTQATIVLNGPGRVGFDKFTHVTGGAEGRMTGGGSIFTPAGVRVTHGFELHCNASIMPNRLQINIHTPQRDRFHLESLTSATCLDDPAIAPPPPAAPFDTYTGVGTGRFNGVSGFTINWTFTDAGEPGTSDQASYLIWLDSNGNDVVDAGEVPVLQVGLTNLTFGNHQAHPENKSATPTIGAWQAHSDTHDYPDYWPPTGWTQNQRVRGAFSRAGSSPYTKLGNDSLLQSLSYADGATLQGAAQILLRAGVAALLGASHPMVSYPLAPGEIQSLVNAALHSQDQATITDLAGQLSALDALKYWKIPTK